VTASGTSSVPSGSGTNAPVGGGATTHKKVNPGALAGEIIGAIVLLALIVFSIIFCKRRNRKKANQSAPAAEYNPAYGGQPAMSYAGTVSPNFTGTTGKAYVSTNYSSLSTCC